MTDPSHDNEPVLTLKTGRRPPTGAPSLKLSQLAAVLPPHPGTYTDGASLRAWQMLGNDQYGDCVAVTWATQRRIASWNNSHDTYPTFDQVIQVYKTQNPDFPNQDDGMVIQDLLNYLHKTGGPDGVKIVAFAQVNHTNFEELKAATYLGQQLWLGVNVSMTNEQQFNDSLPWTVTGSVIGGHSVTAVGYGASGVGIETWGNLGSLSQSYCINISNPYLPGVEEAWLVIWPEQAGLLTQSQRDAFQVAYGQVTGGKVIDWGGIPPAPDPTPPPPPVPTPPPPPPVPVPPPAPDPLHQFLAKLRELWTLIDNWLKSQGV